MVEPFSYDRSNSMEPILILHSKEEIEETEEGFASPSSPGDSDSLHVAISSTATSSQYSPGSMGRRENICSLPPLPSFGDWREEQDGT